MQNISYTELGQFHYKHLSGTSGYNLSQKKPLINFEKE